MAENRGTTSQLLQARIKKFSRVEKAFYLSIAITALVLAISVVYMKKKRQSWMMINKKLMN